uniref:Uncharacterized protein n=1 Tax=Nelumbo nucifera TaxID=4432 RepID=A0A822ZZL9_NELNU|nr:TPA_asm: hypothetical protein HUJ06_017325 [Nelumbo nucifera]
MLSKPVKLILFTSFFSMQAGLVREKSFGTTKDRMLYIEKCGSALGSYCLH